MRNNVVIHIERVSNCYWSGITITGYNKGQWYAPKKRLLAELMNPKYAEQNYTFNYDDWYDEEDEELVNYEWIEEEQIDWFLEDYCEKNNINFETIILKRFF